MNEQEIIKMSCSNCESLEKHKKEDDMWVCLWCGNMRKL